MKLFIQMFFVFNSVVINNTAYAQAPENPPDSEVQDIFPPSPLKENYNFHFNGKFDEVFIRMPDSIQLNAILFHSVKQSKGVIFYLHGNSGALDKWGKIASVYTKLNFDIFMFDYRGYGKSGGKIRNEKQLYSDVQFVYNSVKAHYSEKNIIILGYSIGTGPAAMLASTNHPEKLILQAPYYSLSDAIHVLAPTLDTMQMPFQFNTYMYFPNIICPIVIFHGNADKTFYYGSSQKLMMLSKAGDMLITLQGADHSDMEKNKTYLTGLKKVLQ